MKLSLHATGLLGTYWHDHILIPYRVHGRSAFRIAIDKMNDMDAYWLDMFFSLGTNIKNQEGKSYLIK